MKQLAAGATAACEDDLGKFLPLAVSVCTGLTVFLLLRIPFAWKAFPFQDQGKSGDTETSALIEGSQIRDRFDWIDCCRFWLVTAVVVGHAISFPCDYMPGSKYFLRPWLVWSATFHMPGLAFLSGMCSQGPLTQERTARIMIMIAAPYVFARSIDLAVQWAFQCRFYGQCSFATQLSFNGNDGVEWYLASLFVWRLAAPMLLKFRAEVLIALSVGAGVFSGYYQSIITAEIFDFSMVLSLAPRTVTFLPFFAAGLCVHPAVFHDVRIRWPQVQQLAGVTLFVALAACFAQASFGSGLAPLEKGAIGDFNFDYIAPRIDPEKPWTYLSLPSCGPAYQFAGLHRAARYALSFLAVALFCCAVPVGYNQITEAGRHTMYPYLLHQYPLYLQGFLLTMRPTWMAVAIGLGPNTGAGTWHDPRSWVLWFGTGLLAACFTYVATLPGVRGVFSNVIEPEWLKNLTQVMPSSAFKAFMSKPNASAAKKCAV